MTETDAAMSNAEDDTYGKKNCFPWHRGGTEADMILSLDFVDGRTVLPLYWKIKSLILEQSGTTRLRLLFLMSLME